MSDDARAVLESIAYGADERISPGDRLRAIEALGELPTPPNAETDGLTVEAIEAEIDDFHAMMLTTMFLASGPEAVATDELDPQRYPKTRRALLEAVARLAERVIAEDEAAGRWGEVLMPLPAPSLRRPSRNPRTPTWWSPSRAGRSSRPPGSSRQRAGRLVSGREVEGG